MAKAGMRDAALRADARFIPAEVRATQHSTSQIMHFQPRFQHSVGAHKDVSRAASPLKTSSLPYALSTQWTAGPPDMAVEMLARV